MDPPAVEGLKHDGLDVNIDALVVGVRHAFSSAKSQLTPEQQHQTLAGLQKEMTDKVVAQRMVAGEMAKTEGEEFLAANKAKDGVKTLSCGLQYQIISEGNGPQPKETDQVTVNYRGTLVDGTEFDSSYKRGVTATFPVNGMMKGWGEVLPLMMTGAKRQLFVPASMAYGEQRADRDIPPNVTLVFKIELLSAKS